MKIKVSVPATSANVGSGFDALGLAVTLYNTVTFEESDHLEISSADGTRIPRNESNLVYRSAKGLFDKVGKTIPPLKIVQTNPIPMARGLGSSSACIIAGLLGANRMLGDVLNTQELLTLATSIEGHPDNVAPAVYGGLTMSWDMETAEGVGSVPIPGGEPMHNGFHTINYRVADDLTAAVFVPDYELSSLRGKIKRTQARLEELDKLQARQDAPEAAEEHDGFQIVRNAEQNRLQILFDGKPDEATRAALKQNGFRWSPRNSAWQRQLTDNAERAARRALGLE